jgi:hypothetical protein
MHLRVLKLCSAALCATSSQQISKRFHCDVVLLATHSVLCWLLCVLMLQCLGLLRAQLLVCCVVLAVKELLKGSNVEVF